MRYFWLFSDCVVIATGCTDEEAREYLIAEEGDERDAIISYRTDRIEVAR